MINKYTLGKQGAAIIKEFEGLRLDAYRCPANVLTVGWGHTGPDVKTGMVITLDQAEELFTKDVQKFVEGVNYAVRIQLTQNQFDALVCLSYNIGVSAFQHSTLLRKLNAGDIKGAAAEFLRWNKGGGVILAGLTRRRIKEAALFSNGLKAVEIPASPRIVTHEAQPVRDTNPLKQLGAEKFKFPDMWIDNDGNARGSDGKLL